ncbi:MAG TPA: hypothetical protein VGQ06_06595 [Gemmatimonadales bacterium]|jgi:hypothetical protein|nr:hypothetical protein [Gemmatimonadales bacterium]
MTPRRHVACAVVLGVVASWRLGAAQGAGWVTAPARPTVADTVWLARLVPAGPGWWVRAGKLPATPVGEPLADPAVGPTVGGGGWTVRYAMVVWTPGPMVVEMPPVWRLGPDGSADSLPGGTASFTVASVIPDSAAAPAPRPALAPLRVARRTPLPALAALLFSAGVLVAVIAWRRRLPRSAAAGLDLMLDPEVGDERWVAAGEPKAVAARAVSQLRDALARAVPEAHAALSTPECLEVVERTRPGAPIRELRELLGALDQVAFATAHGTDVVSLAARARALAERLAPLRTAAP